MSLTHTRPAARTCPRCGVNRSPIAYARAKEVTVYHPDYDDLEGERMVAAYQEDQLKIFRRLMDYDKVLEWTKTTPRKVVGWAGRIAYHPFRRYLNDVDPVKEGWYRWDIYPSACDALKQFTHIPHTCSITVLECFKLHPGGVTFTLYCPLPAWTRGIMERIAGLPFDSKISRELFLTMLRTRAAVT